MNNKPIAQSGNADLRASEAALLRAAQRARELAQRTGTRLVVSQNGVLQYIEFRSTGVAEPDASYENPK